MKPILLVKPGALDEVEVAKAEAAGYAVIIHSGHIEDKCSVKVFYPPTESGMDDLALAAINAIAATDNGYGKDYAHRFVQNLASRLNKTNQSK